MNFGLLQCVIVGLSLLKVIRILASNVKGEAVHVCGWGIWEFSIPPFQCYSKYKVFGEK